MKSHKWMPALALVALSIMMIATFQNCGPAVISGDSTADAGIKKSTVGSRVDLTAVQASPVEKASNVLYPSQMTVQKSYYSDGSPIIENVVLNLNDFDYIEWIHLSTGIVLSNEATFQSRPFSNGLYGQVAIVGHRGTAMYRLGTIEFSAKGATLLNLNSVGAVTVAQTPISIGGPIETHVVSVDAPNVDVTSIQLTNLATGQKYLNQKALAFSKASTQKVDIEIAMTDRSGQSFVKTVTFPAAVVNPGPQSDLLIMAITWTPAAPLDGSDVRFYATVKNIGTVATPAATIMGLKFLVDDVLVSWSDANVASLAPGASVTIVAATGVNGKFNWTAKVGTHTVTAVVDELNRIPESVETNNQLNATIYVGAAPPTTTLPPPPVTTTTLPAPPPTTTTTMPAPPNAITLSVAGAPNLPYNGTTTLVTVGFTGATPTKVTLARDGLAAFATWPGGTFFTLSSDGKSVSGNWCISASCWGNQPGAHTLMATATYADGTTKSSTVALNVVDSTPTTTLPPPPPTTTLPPATVSVPGSISAVDMSYKSVGKQEGTVWNIFSIGEVSNKFYFPTTGTYTIRVSAFGSIAQSVWPTMEIRVDKVVVLSRTVNTTALTVYNLDVNIAAGVHDIEIGFTNDYNSTTEDRNLYVGTVTIDPQAIAPTGGISNLAVRSDQANIYVSFNYPGTITYPRLFMDTDQNAFTGYANSGIGADYLVENGLVYKYSGTSNSWTWTRVGYSGMVNTAPTLRWSLPRSIFTPMTAINFVASVNTTGFTTVNSHTLSTATSTTLAISDGPYLFNVSATSATVQWSLNMVGTGKIEYGVTTGLGSTSLAETTFNYSTHQQNLTGLTSKTTYYYRIVSTSQSGATVTTPIASFTTP